jgi:hypothetical protein
LGAYSIPSETGLLIPSVDVNCEMDALLHHLSKGRRSGSRERVRPGRMGVQSRRS